MSLAQGTEPPRSMGFALPQGRRAVQGRVDYHLPWPVLAYLLCVMLPIGFNLGPLHMTSVRALMMLFIIPLFIGLLMGRYGRFMLTDALFTAYVLWMGIALSLNSPAQMITQMGSLGMEFLGGYLVGRCFIRSRAQFIALCRWLVLLVLLTLPFALFETLTNRPLIIEALRSIPGMNTVSIVRAEPRLGLERVQGNFAHPIHYGLFCSIAFSLCFVALKDVFSTTRRFISSGLIALCGFLALSSGALLAIFLQIGLITWAIVFDKLRWRWWLLVGLFALAYVVIDILSTRTPIRVFMSYATFSAHNAYWRGIIFEWGVMNILGNAENNIPPSPWTGIGMNDWVRPWYMFSGSMDNFWLVVAIRYGLPGLVFLVLGYVLIIAKVMRRNLDGDPELLRIRRAWVFTFLGLSFTLSTVHVWGNIYSFVFFLFGAGVWIITEALQNDTAGPGADGPTAPEPDLSATHTPYSRFPSRPRAPLQA